MKDEIFIALVGDIVGEELAREITKEPIRSKTGMIETKYARAYALIMGIADASSEAADQECCRGDINEAVKQFKDYFAFCECLRYMELKFKLL